MGEPILTDFGIAKLMSSMSSTQSSLQLGTPLYISPEQARGELGSERSDLYSLGVILYEMVTGVLPFRGNTPVDVIMQHANSTPIMPSLINPSIPTTLSAVIARAMAKDPAARYASASEMTIAIAGALNVPVAEVLSSSNTPSLPVIPLSPQPPVAASTLQSITTQDTHIAHPGASVGSGQVFAQNASQSPSAQHFVPAGRSPGSSFSTPSPALMSPAPPNRVQRRRTVYIVGSLLLIVALLGVGLAAFFYWPTFFPAFSGHAFYVSSGQLSDGAQGIADELQLDLRNIPAPQAGKSYHVWLLGDQDPVKRDDLLTPRPVTPPILLTNNLSVSNGSVHFLYPGDAQHNNLLSNTSRLLITEENAGSSNSAPSPDRTNWRYFAILPQLTIPGDSNGFSALIHIRHLFYNETDIKILGLYGGLDIYVFRNTEKILEWGVSARDDWHGAATSDAEISLIRNQFIRILDYLDGTLNRHVDVPNSVPFLADQQIARVSLLTVDPVKQSPPFFSQNPPGDIDHMQLHVDQVTKATDITPEMRQSAQHILVALNNLGGKNGWLTSVHSDAVQLFNMSQNAVQLRQPAAGALLDDLVTKATYAYIGKLNPANNTVQPGVTQIHYDVQHLATFTLTANIPDHL
jgi:serine/threonine protein kinase